MGPSHWNLAWMKRLIRTDISSDFISWTNRYSCQDLCKWAWIHFCSINFSKSQHIRQWSEISLTFSLYLWAFIRFYWCFPTKKKILHDHYLHLFASSAHYYWSRNRKKLRLSDIRWMIKRNEFQVRISNYRCTFYLFFEWKNLSELNKNFIDTFRWLCSMSFINEGNIVIEQIHFSMRVFIEKHMISIRFRQNKI